MYIGSTYMPAAKEKDWGAVAGHRSKNPVKSAGNTRNFPHLGRHIFPRRPSRLHRRRSTATSSALDADKPASPSGTSQTGAASTPHPSLQLNGRQYIAISSGTNPPNLRLPQSAEQARALPFVRLSS